MTSSIFTILPELYADLLMNIVAYLRPPGTFITWTSLCGARQRHIGCLSRLEGTSPPPVWIAPDDLFACHWLNPSARSCTHPRYLLAAYSSHNLCRLPHPLPSEFGLFVACRRNNSRASGLSLCVRVHRHLDSLHRIAFSVS